MENQTIDQNPNQNLPNQIDANVEIGHTSKKSTKAIFVLLILLLFIASGFAVLLGRGLNQKTKTQPNLTPETTKPLFLSFDSPVDEALVYDSELIVTGRTLPNIPLVIYTENDQNSVQSDAEGKFEGNILLTNGINNLIVTAFDDKGDEKTVSVSIVYDEQVKGAKTNNDQTTGQTKTDNQNNKATVGEIGKVNNNSIIVEEKKKIRTESIIDSKTQIFNQNNKQIKQSQLKVKDTAAIINDKTVSATSPGQIKKAIKIYVREASSSAQLKRRAVHGVITNINGNVLTLTHPTQTNRAYTLFVNSQTIVKSKAGIVTLTDLVVGQRITSVGDLDSAGNLTAKQIHIIPGKAIGVFKKNPISTPSGVLSVTPEATISAMPTITTTPIPTLTSSPTPTEGL